MKRKIYILLIICIALLGIGIYILDTNTNYIRKVECYIFRRNEAPINEEGLINNYYFKISNDGTNEINTTRGLREAMEYAQKNNIEYVKLEKGIYRVIGTGENNNLGLTLVSNMTLDLNNSTIVQAPNSSECYITILAKNIENARIKNGILIGDRNEHNYSALDSTHEWGMGVSIQESKNITVDNLTITDMTGDGVYIAYESENICIKNCNISNCRRQGISIIEGKNIEIHDNEIFDIGGTSPQCLIDLEANKASQVIDKIKIYRNKLYASKSYSAVKLYYGCRTVEIFENDLYGNINVHDVKETVHIYQNKLYNGKVHTYGNEEDERFIINKIIVNDNELYQYDVNNIVANEVKVEGNRNGGE